MPPAFSFDAKTREYSRRNAYWLGRASLLAYQDEATVRTEVQDWGLTDITFFDLHDTQAFVAGNDDLLMLAFRGTSNLQDWLTDASFTFVAGPGGQVHEGFHLALSYVWIDIWRYIREQRRGRSLWVTGHSLGAALATLAVARLRVEKDEPVNGLYNFGQPRAGDRDFATRFDTDFERQTFRYVNNDDIVPRVPFRSMQYSHVGLLKYFDADGVQDDDVSWWDLIVNRVKGEIQGLIAADIEDIRDHQMTAYVANLERALP